MDKEGGAKPNVRKGGIVGIRHSIATYKHITKTLEGESPASNLADAEQNEIDLTDEGIEHARQNAREFLSRLDSAKDTLFFVSSNQRRALDTADIYREEATAQGFVIENETRLLKDLSLESPNLLTNALFMPERTLPNINWRAVSEEVRTRWEEARKIIHSDDQGSWGANFLKHSAEIKKLFPNEIRSAEDLYEKEFKNLLRLARFGFSKTKGTSIKILAFGHENYVLWALQKHFGDTHIGNCEEIELDQDENGALLVNWRGKQIIWKE